MLSHQIVSLPPIYSVDYDDVAGIDMDQGAGDLAVFVIPFKCTLELVGGAITETCAGADTTPIVNVDKRPTAGSDASRGDKDAGLLTLGTSAAGKFVYDADKAGLVLYPGQELVFQLATAAVGDGKAGHIRPVVLVRYVPETYANLSNMVDVGAA